MSSADRIESAVYFTDRCGASIEVKRDMFASCGLTHGHDGAHEPAVELGEQTTSESPAAAQDRGCLSEQAPDTVSGGGTPGTSSAATALRPCDREILDALANGPLSTRELSDHIYRRVWAAWSEAHGYDFEWETDEEPVGARLLASSEAREGGLKLQPWEIDPRLRSLEKRGAVERIQIEGKRPMLWSRHV